MSNVHDRAYGWPHRRRRRRLLREAIGMPCPFCGRLMLDPKAPGGEPLHLDHSDPSAKLRGLPGDRIAHASCNVRAGNGTRALRHPQPTRDPGHWIGEDWYSVEW